MLLDDCKGQVGASWRRPAPSRRRLPRDGARGAMRICHRPSSAISGARVVRSGLGLRLGPAPWLGRCGSPLAKRGPSLGDIRQHILCLGASGVVASGVVATLGGSGLCPHVAVNSSVLTVHSDSSRTPAPVARKPERPSCGLAAGLWRPLRNDVFPGRPAEVTRKCCANIQNISPSVAGVSPNRLTWSKLAERARAMCKE